MDDERFSPRAELVVASANTGTRPVPARAPVIEYAASAELITTANRLSGAQPGKLMQSNWATAVDYRTMPRARRSTRRS